MDEAEQYQQRLQAIAERRRQQEEEERLTRETEEEWWKTAQEKRKNLREQWLSETLDSFTSRPRLQDEADEHTTAEQTKSQKTPEAEEEEAADAREKEDASQEEESVNCTAAAHSHDQAGTDEDVEVNEEAEDHFSIQMAQRMFHESGQEGRSVLGMVAVQVERDPKTGATVVRSVAPMSTPPGAPRATAVFDDGRKSIHAVGGSAAQPSSEELGQILSIVDGVGMKVLLDEVTVTPNKPETKIENVDKAPEGKVLSFSTSKEDKTQSGSSRRYDWEAELRMEDFDANKEDEKDDRGIIAVRDIPGEVDNVEDLSLEEGPVTLVFMGYTDGDQEVSQEDQDEGMIKVERVMITEDGEEHVLGPETPAESPAKKESQVFQDVPLDGNGAGVKVQGEEGDKGMPNSSSPTIAEGEGAPKRKTCQCCSIM